MENGGYRASGCGRVPKLRPAPEPGKGDLFLLESGDLALYCESNRIVNMELHIRGYRTGLPTATDTRQLPTALPTDRKRKPLPSDEYGLWCAGLAPSVLSGRCPCLGRSIHSFIRHTEAEAEPTEPCVRYEYPAGHHNYSPQTQSRRTSHSPHPLTSCFGAVISQVDCAPSKLACAAAKTLLPGPNSSAALFQPSAIVETGFAHGDHENRGPDSHCATS